MLPTNLIVIYTVLRCPLTLSCQGRFAGVAQLPTRGGQAPAPLAARLLTWVEGQTLSAVTAELSDDAAADALLEDAGRFLGRVKHPPCLYSRNSLELHQCHDAVSLRISHSLTKYRVLCL